MKPESSQLICQIMIAVGGLISVISVFGNYYYGKRIDKNNGTELITTVESVKSDIDSSIVSNTGAVLKAIGNVQRTVEEISDSKFLGLKDITYPDVGEFGENLICKEKLEYTSGSVSMKVLMPKGKTVRVKVCGEFWEFPVMQALGGWKYSDYNDKDKSRFFSTVKAGVADFEIYLKTGGETRIEIYENNSIDPTWVKEISVKGG